DYAWLKEHLAELGVGVLAVDVGSFSTADFADVSSDEVIDAAGEDAAKLRERRDRGEMMAVMGRGAAKIVQKLAEEGRIHGILAVGGSGGSSVAAPAMQAVPVGFPKLLVSTMASGDVSPYVGETDTTIMYSVVDVAGVNRISAMVLGNAAAGIAGMAKAYEARLTSTSRAHRPLVGLSMFGLTTPAADEARKTLTELGYEVLVFHATGAGGRAMEKLIESGLLAGVCDLTTTELADDLVGGVLSAGPERLEMAGRMGTPQVVSLGALDMVNFGPKDTVSSKFDGRTFVVHNPTVTLMRTSRSETEELGRRIGTKLAAATGPSELFIPTNGLSGIDVEGGPFYDPEADAALFDAVKTNLEGSGVPIHEHECAVNDEGFGRAMAERLHELIRNQSGKKEN
ncbi:MAG: Tm-1-like ATP-binding domain-containing protein, partial [Dermabacter sp.]|nr:Tm-1-like ATP-binding domain-containing protein [Dermabacter sp.]